MEAMVMETMKAMVQLRPQRLQDTCKPVLGLLRASAGCGWLMVSGLDCDLGLRKLWQCLQK